MSVEEENVSSIFEDRFSEEELEAVNKTLNIPNKFEYISSICGWFCFKAKENDENDLEKYMIYEKISKKKLIINEEDILPLKSILRKIDDVNDFNHAVGQKELQHVS